MAGAERRRSPNSSRWEDPVVSEQTVHHPVFARVFDRLSPLMEREAGDHREELLAGLSGRVVEIGPATE